MKELGSLAEARSWRRCCPVACEMRGELPAGSASHAETTDHNPVLVDPVMAAYAVQRLKEVDFARELVGVVVTTVEVKDDSVVRCELAGVAHPVPEEVHFAQRLIPSVEPGFDSPFVWKPG